MAPINLSRTFAPKPSAAPNPEAQTNIGLYIGVGFGVVTAIGVIFCHHHGHHHGKARSTKHEDIITRAPKLQVPLAVVAKTTTAGNDQVVRPALPRKSSKSSSSTSSRKSKSSSRRSSDRSYAARAAARSHHQQKQQQQQQHKRRGESRAIVGPRCSSLRRVERSSSGQQRHQKRRSSSALLPRRSDALGWPLPRVVVTDVGEPVFGSKPRTIIRAQIRPMPGAAANGGSSPSSRLLKVPQRDLRRTEKFSMTPSERHPARRISRDGEYSTSSEDELDNRSSYVSGASSGICDYLKLLNSSPSPEERRQQQQRQEEQQEQQQKVPERKNSRSKRTSPPRLPALDVSSTLSLEMDDDKYRI
ncbi:hypothetical protein E8E14_004931 [Neopestalotiopsis sp. 37M]|nr:hypothetical protein E8E14_004931 [Neopestalotiopsis sp. 37M]